MSHSDSHHTEERTAHSNVGSPRRTFLALVFVVVLIVGGLAMGGRYVYETYITPNVEKGLDTVKDKLDDASTRGAEVYEQGIHTKRKVDGTIEQIEDTVDQIERTADEIRNTADELNETVEQVKELVPND